eukprot:COSAG04_NODE_1091_length_8331_cov_12.367954_1_plen_1314_part_00
MAQANERVNSQHWGVSKAFIREQRDRWAAEGARCRGMTVAEYFEAIGLGQVYEKTWGWCAGVLAELEAKEEKTADDEKEIAYYKRKVDKTEKYEDMELTDWMNVLKHQDLAGPPRTNEPERPERKIAYASLIAEESDGSGRRKVGRATVFVSHVWKMTAKDFFEVCLAEMGEEDYAWIDLYLHNQYQGQVSDIGDENSEYWIDKFGELIGGIKKVIAIVTDWERPVMLTRIWCLFELNAAIDTGAELRFVSTAAERQGLSLNLGEKFAELEARVNSIEVRDCDAKRPHEIQDKAIFLGKLQGIEDEVNAKLRKEMRRWLAEAAEGVLSRTDPHRPPLTEAELAVEEAHSKGSWINPWGLLCLCFCCCFRPTGAKATRLLERRPRLPAVLNGLALGCIVAALAGVWWFGIRAKWRGEKFEDEEALAMLGGALLLMFLGFGLNFLAGHLQEHQAARQLRRPPLLGARAFQQRRAIVTAASLLGFVGLPLAADLALGEPGPEVSDDNSKTLVPLLRLLALLLGGVAAQGIAALAHGPGEIADARARLCAQVGWLRLALGEAGKAAEILGTAHEERLQTFGPDEAGGKLDIYTHEGSYGAAPGYARALCEAGRKEEADELVRQVEAAAERNAASWRRFLRQVVTLTFAEPPRAVKWRQRGALLQARMAAAVGERDVDVLELLEEAGQTDWGKIQVLDTNQPELGDFLQRMNGGNASLRQVEQRKWESLPPLMRSAGDNPLSAWVKYTCEGQAYYKRDDPKETSLEPPSDGVKQVAEAGMPGLGWSREQWESEYADLGGPGCWSEQRNRRYKLTAKAKKAGWALFFLGTLVTLFCWAFVYIECGEHGLWGVGSCNCVDNFAGRRCESSCGDYGVSNGPSCSCTDGFSGSRCDVCRCIDGCPCPALPAEMAETYTIYGAAESKYDGQYERLSAECNGKPVYQLGGEGGYVLFQPTDRSDWWVGNSDHSTSCEASGFISSSGNGGDCPLSPDGAGCEREWQETTGCDDDWCGAPGLAVSTCPAANPCCGVDCGAHGRVESAGCACACSDGFVGDFCQLATAYVISNATLDSNGRYERLAGAECNGKPVYELGGEGGVVLFQPTDTSRWMVGSSDHSTSCRSTGYDLHIKSSGNGGVCPLSPDGAGCAGRWQEQTFDCRYSFCDAPGLAVSTCPADNPCCGIDCGAHGRLDGASCACACSDGFVGAFCQLASAYIVSNATRDGINGRYERLADAECNGKPVYQLGGEGRPGYILFQPTDRSDWWVSTSDRSTTCRTGRSYVISTLYTFCPLSPDGGGCAGRWQEFDGDAWQDTPGLAVVSG